MKKLEELFEESSIRIKTSLNENFKVVYDVYHHDKLIDTHTTKRAAKINAIIIQDSLTTKII
jgi:hypothetical protein